MDDRSAITELLHSYFDGLYHSDVERLRRVFHPKAIYASATEGELLYRTMEDYFAVVAVRPAPASKNEPRRDTIESIAFGGPVTALARVRCAIGPKYFTDFLSLVKLGGEWKIISKVFDYETV